MLIFKSGSIYIQRIMNVRNFPPMKFGFKSSKIIII